MTIRRVLVLTIAFLAASTSAAQKPAGVFEQPIVMARYGQQQLRATELMKRGQLKEARAVIEESIELAPQYAQAHYNLACVLALEGKKDEAFAVLDRAIARGFANPKHIEEDADFKDLREDERFKKAVAAAKKAKPLILWPEKVETGQVKDGEYVVGAKNTAWNAIFGFFTCSIEKPTLPKDTAVVDGFGPAGDLVRKWYKEGTAAGNVGDFYDNHDEDHSNMNYARFPQLTRIEFGPDVKAAKPLQLHRGLQIHFFYTGIVLGNASVASTGTPFWRSMTRAAYTDQRAINVLHNQYVNSHLYLYPEHQDHDPGRNGQGGHGDVFPANTPYVITSQGSSGSDVVFLDALACTLAAFRPEVKEKLHKEHALMPVVQMIFRSSNKNVKKADDYLTGTAHPSVFEGGNLDVVKMVTAAHDLTLDNLPPLVSLKVVEEDKPVFGRDCFDAGPRGEQLFTTPGAIARIMRSTNHTRRMVVSAEGSRDLNKKDISYHWVVLRGDPKRVSIKPLDKTGKQAEILVDWQERRPVEPGSKLESNRVDIGVFADNGKHKSAPAFVTFYSLDNQKRTYDEKKRIKEVDYNDADIGKNYVDPLVDFKKDWRDEYHYTGDVMTGWTRHRGKEKEEFHADGTLIVKKDDKGRAAETKPVMYVPRQKERGKAPTLEQTAGEERLLYKYESDDDRVGKVVKRLKPL